MKGDGALLQLDGVSKRFGAVVVADAITLSIGPGEALGIVGANGAGKSSLFNLITGVLRPDQGSIRLKGREVTSASRRDRCLAGIGRSFQVPRPFKSMTVFENLLAAASFGRPCREAEAVEICASILEKTGLVTRANARAGSLTLLDRKRLELARALATGPEVLLLDEIAGGLTEAECHELVALVRAIHADGVTVLWIEHIVHALLAVATRLLVLEFGRKLAEGKPREVMERPEVRRSYLGIH